MDDENLSRKIIIKGGWTWKIFSEILLSSMKKIFERDGWEFIKRIILWGKEKIFVFHERGNFYKIWEVKELRKRDDLTKRRKFQCPPEFWTVDTSFITRNGIWITETDEVWIIFKSVSSSWRRIIPPFEFKFIREGKLIVFHFHLFSTLFSQIRLFRSGFSTNFQSREIAKK